MRHDCQLSARFRDDGRLDVVAEKCARAIDSRVVFVLVAPRTLTTLECCSLLFLLMTAVTKYANHIEREWLRDLFHLQRGSLILQIHKMEPRLA